MLGDPKGVRLQQKASAPPSEKNDSRNIYSSQLPVSSNRKACIPKQYPQTVQGDCLAMLGDPKGVSCHKKPALNVLS